jgi:hypothetical protein
VAKGDFGHNATISTRGFGSRQVRAMTVDFGLAIVASSDNEGRSRRAFYPKVTSGSSFTLGLGFISWGEREAFNRWMSRFMEAVSTGAARHGSMTVRVPSRNFVRVAVPEGPLEFGEGVGDMTYRTNVSFVGASDPVNVALGARMAGVSYFKGPGKHQVSRFFYPAGRQIGGSESLEGTLFDTSPSGSNSPIVVPAEDEAADPLDRHGIDEPGV